MLLMLSISKPTYSQSLFHPRCISLGAYDALVRDAGNFDRNPAGLVHINNWNAFAGTYVSTTGGGDGFIFQGAALGKKFLERHTVAIQFAPGSIMQFAIPSTIVLVDSTSISVDQEIVYEEPISLGYAFSLPSNLSLGLGGRFRKENVTDREYGLVDLDSISVISSSERFTESALWLVDASVLWEVDDFSASLVGRNLVHLGNTLPEELSNLELARPTAMEFGIAYHGVRTLTFVGEVSSYGTWALGTEWTPEKPVAIRTGLMWRNGDNMSPAALGCGAGWSYGPVNIDVSYLHYFDQSYRTGSFPIEEFDPGRITSVDFNPYLRNRLTLTASAVFGETRRSVVGIEHITMLGGIYPSAIESYAFNPVATVLVKNTSTEPVTARAEFMIDDYMSSPTETKTFRLEPQEEKEVRLTAVFNESMRSVQRLSVREATVSVKANSEGDGENRTKVAVLVHGNNDWNGNPASLRYFVQPDDPAVLRYAREILHEHQSVLDTVPSHLVDFTSARLIVEGLAGKITYVSDPTQSSDHVQYPAQTLELRGGDCDDMTVCVSSLFNSAGISTAFVSSVPPDHKDEGHIYLMFDTGIEPRYGEAVTSNAKRYVVRRNEKGAETIWIPIETTVISKGWEDAWSSGAQRYFDDVELGLGLIQGWVKILDVY